MNEAETPFGEKHVQRYRETDGEVGHRWKRGSKILLLTTKGRRSGEPRAKPLIYEQDGDRYVIVASKGGAPAHPDWYLNLQKEPNVELQLLDEVFPARARPRRVRSASDCGSSSTSSGRTTTATRRRPTGRFRWSSSSERVDSMRSPCGSS
jgi:deazaflavin-dependent oxidoreductase (nitroreductase family)